jgi:hypothetical protein
MISNIGKKRTLKASPQLSGECGPLLFNAALSACSSRVAPATFLLQSAIVQSEKALELHAAWDWQMCCSWSPTNHWQHCKCPHAISDFWL